MGLQKCEARAVGHRKPCGGFIELGLSRLGLGWPVAFRPGHHITIGDKVGQFGLCHVWLYDAKLAGELESKVGMQSWESKLWF